MLKLKSTKAQKAKRTRRINKAKRTAETYLGKAKSAFAETIDWVKENPSEAIMLALTVAVVDLDGDIEEISETLS